MDSGGVHDWGIGLDRVCYVEFRFSTDRVLRGSGAATGMLREFGCGAETRGYVVGFGKVEPGSLAGRIAGICWIQISNHPIDTCKIISIGF